MSVCSHTTKHHAVVKMNEGDSVHRPRQALRHAVGETKGEAKGHLHTVSFEGFFLFISPTLDIENIHIYKL